APPVINTRRLTPPPYGAGLPGGDPPHAMQARGGHERRSGHPQPPGRARGPVVRLTSRWRSGYVCGDSPAVSGGADDVPGGLRRPSAARGWGPGSAPRCTHVRTAGVAIIVPVRGGIAYRPGDGENEHPTTLMMAVALAYGYGSDVAVMVTVGGPHAPNTASPVEKMVTVLGLELLQRTRPSCVPLTSTWKTMLCSGPSSATAGKTTMSIAGPTSSVAVSATPLTSATIKALPSSSATAVPFASTLATPGLRLSQFTGWGGSRLPLTSYSC